ncbi:mRNA-decapping enzyme 1B-like [Haliotis cracherodii]|uniref:mRNA-decapping enzyme 1B-like n=1 Tax=Haliotis cracherodii TaxID=6455 RepID=UPI0039E77631
MAESRMNLATLQQRDPYITEIADTASQVALYSFSSKSNEWEKTSIEGSLFVYKRSATPLQGFMILNRLGLNNLIEPITKDLEFQVQDPFLLYRNAKNIYGIWFYEKDECARIGNLMNKFLHVAVSKADQSIKVPAPVQKAPEPVDLTKQMIGRDKPPGTQPGEGQVDIMQMLTKAQSEYVKAKGAPGPTKEEKPRPMTDHITTVAPTSNVNLVRPTPVKFSLDGSPSEEMPAIVSGNLSQPAPDSSGPMTLEALFRKASISQHRGGMVDASTAELPDVTKPSVLQRSISMVETESHKDKLPPMLQKLISTGQTVEEIERQQISHNIHERPRSEGCDSLKPDGTSPIPMQDPLLHKPLMAGLHQLLVPGASKHHGPGGATQPGAKSCDVTMAGDAPLLKPSDIEQGGTGLAHSASMLPSTLMAGDVGILPSSSVSCPDVLLSPMAFSSSHDKRKSPPLPTTPTTQQPVALDRTQSDGSEPEQSTATSHSPLTKEQLQQALLYLIKNDNTFVSTVHEAYLKSFKALSGHKS